MALFILQFVLIDNTVKFLGRKEVSETRASAP
jgi:hypothetical protein